jgi:hypothetical protein
MVLVNCKGYGGGIFVDPDVYPNGKEIDIRCSSCSRINWITL